MAVADDTRRRVAATVTGAVQGVGFRPFVYRIARERSLAGWVSNTGEGVRLEVEGPAPAVESFLRALRSDAPAHAVIDAVAVDERHPERDGATAADGPPGRDEFVIVPSSGGAKAAFVLPELATCPACLDDIRNPADRRYRYPFTNCTHCGPRFSILKQLPYDRPHTTMAGFEMCPACRAEYDDPLDRRFHAQPTACPECGPRLAWREPDGRETLLREDALQEAVARIRAGEIVAVKGLGGFHLVVRADDDAAVRRLRERKQREEKPFALMVPDLATARSLCEVSEAEAELLTSAQAPIVLLQTNPTSPGRTSRPGHDQPGHDQSGHDQSGHDHSGHDQPGHAGTVAPAVAPGNPTLGLMLPYTPLHHLLLEALNLPVVATSGNRSDEPICIDEDDAVRRLGAIADGFLVHDRPIARPVDDSVARVLTGEPQLLRRSRGYAPMPIPLPGGETSTPTLASGAFLKNTVALGLGGKAFLSQHIGDLETEGALAAFEDAAAQLAGLYGDLPERIACDLHPDYPSTRWAAARAADLVPVQHHAAHLYAVAAEHGLRPPALGFGWDGTGLGADRTVWGGEVIRLEADGGWTRVAHLRPFHLPGGDAAAREPRRSALGLLHALAPDQAANRADRALAGAFTAYERAVLLRMLDRGANCPQSTSAGRLFDAVAALLGLRHRASFEGQAAMMLEWAADPHEAGAYPLDLRPSEDRDAPAVLDWTPMLESLLADQADGVSVATLAARFHNSLAAGISHATQTLAAPDEPILLGGGVFQNRRLSETVIAGLREDGFAVHWARQAPPNDGGIALGQLYAAALSAR